DDGVIEAIFMSGRFGSNRTALGIDNDVVGINANFLQHCSHQSCLVFAIAVMMGKDFRSSMGLPSAYSQFDGNVANIALRKICQRFHFFKGSPGRRSERSEERRVGKWWRT